jgi:hypothetical protein
VFKIHSGDQQSFLQVVCDPKKFNFGAIGSSSIINCKRKERVLIQTFLMKLGGNFCAQNSFWRPAIFPTGSLSNKKYITMGH